MRMESSADLNPTENVEGRESRIGKKLVIDIGSGEFSYFNDIKETVDQNKFYAAVDLSHNVKASAREAHLAGMNAAAVIADAQKLPFPDAQASDVVLSDIINSPLLEYKYGKERILGTEVNSAPLPNQVQEKELQNFSDKRGKQMFIIADNIASEAVRVLAPKGRLLIVEKYGITYAKVYDYILEKLKNDPRLVFLQDQTLNKERSLFHDLGVFTRLYEFEKK